VKMIAQFAGQDTTAKERATHSQQVNVKQATIALREAHLPYYTVFRLVNMHLKVQLSHLIVHPERTTKIQARRLVLSVRLVSTAQTSR